MSLLPTRHRNIQSPPSEATPAVSFETGGQWSPLRLLQRLVLFMALTVIFHGFALFIVAQVVRSYPALVTSNPDVATVLCGEGLSIQLDFRPRGAERSRGLSSWIRCVDAAGTVDRDKGATAAVLSGLVLTIPFAMITFGVILRMNSGPHHRRVMLVRTLPGPATWVDRLIVSSMVLLVAAVVTGAAGAYVTQYHPRFVEHPAARRLACGEGLTPAVVFPRSRGRRLACFSEAGVEDTAASRFAMLRVLSPIFALLTLPGLLLAFRIRTVQRVRSRPLAD